MDMAAGPTMFARGAIPPQTEVVMDDFARFLSAIVADVMGPMWGLILPIDAKRVERAATRFAAFAHHVVREHGGFNAVPLR